MNRRVPKPPSQHFLLLFAKRLKFECIGLRS
nr:MAG TPA: hypothetical protein [Caudoviricetes sp.]